MRKFIAILACKLVRLVGKLVGRGSSMPGQIALKLCPDILSRITLPEHIVAVTGSNGKTSTVEMIAEVFRADGRKVLYNAEGSNQIEGVATLILSNCSLSGKLEADVLLLESDERYARHSFRHFKPTEFLILNLYRDQLTRNGHPESVFDAILPAISDKSRLILNADDPLSSCFARGRERVSWFGVEKADFDTPQPVGAYLDGSYCPVCKAPMEYDYAHYNHIGSYHCPSCGHHRPEADYKATYVNLKTGELELDGRVKIDLSFHGIYYIYNTLAAYALCMACGVSAETFAGAISGYVLKNGRRKTFRLGSHHGTLLTSKHENSIAYDTNLRYIAGLETDCTVMFIVDAVSRKYFTSETSWLWDIDFDLLNQPHVQKIILSGRYANDLAERFAYTQLPAERWQVEPDIRLAAEQLKAEGSEDLYVATCFSDRDKLLTLTEAE